MDGSTVNASWRRVTRPRAAITLRRWDSRQCFAEIKQAYAVLVIYGLFWNCDCKFRWLMNCIKKEYEAFEGCGILIVIVAVIDLF